MFKKMRRFCNVYVVGPQRSGTRIAANMVSDDTGHTYVDERAFDCDSLSRLALLLVKTPAGSVIQAPGLTRWVHHLATDQDAVVFMTRSLERIQASEKRIDWQYEHVEAIKYGRSTKPSAQSKIEFWHLHQRGQIRNSFTVSYSALEGHPLWVPSRLRVSFTWDQTA